EVFPLPARKGRIDRIGIYDQYKKPCQALSNLKSGNALLSVMSSKFAEQQGWNDAIILNERGDICEATSSNVFVVKDNVIYTPPLEDGCVMGTMRAFILDHLSGSRNTDKFQVMEKTIAVQDFGEADEVFLTNA